MSVRWFVGVVIVTSLGCDLLGGGGADGGSGGTGGSGGSAGTAGGSSGGAPGVGWRAIALPSSEGEARVTGIHCTARAVCVIATESFSHPGKILAASDSTVGAELVNGMTVTPLAHVSADPGFIGFERTREGLTARLTVSGAWVSGTGDLTKASSWRAVDLGRVDGHSRSTLRRRCKWRRMAPGE